MSVQVPPLHRSHVSVTAYVVASQLPAVRFKVVPGVTGPAGEMVGPGGVLTGAAACAAPTNTRDAAIAAVVTPTRQRVRRHPCHSRKPSILGRRCELFLPSPISVRS
jgi:hypothetical protein